MEAAVGAGQYQQAEQARLEAYAFFEFGPERRLKSFDPGLATDDRGPDLVRRRRQGGAREADRRARAAARRCHETRLVLDHAARRRRRDARRQREQGDGRHQLGDHRLPRGARGGADPRRDHGLVRRRAPPACAGPVLVGAGSACSSSMLTWVLAQTLLELARAVRREARGGGRPGRDRGAAADHELVLPPRLLERVDRALPPPAAQAAGRRARPASSPRRCSGSRCSG